MQLSPTQKFVLHGPYKIFCLGQCVYECGLVGGQQTIRERGSILSLGMAKEN